MSEVNQVDIWWDFLLKRLSIGPTQVLFEKANGTMREMLCTTNQEYIDYEFKKSDGTKTPTDNSESVTVWDVESQGWRKLTKGKIRSVDSIDMDKWVEDNES